MVISWKSRLTVSVTTPALFGARRSSETIVVPGGASPMTTTLPTTSCVEDCISKFAKRTSAWIAAPWAVETVGFIIVKLIVIIVFILAEGG